MAWVKVNSQVMKAARYEETRNRLDVRMTNGKTVRHTNILPHMYQEIVNSDDPDFYYSNYIRPTAVTSAPGFGSRIVQGMALLILLAAVWLVSATETSMQSDPSTREAGMVTAGTGTPNLN